MVIKYHFEVLNIKDKDWTKMDIQGNMIEPRIPNPPGRPPKISLAAVNTENKSAAVSPPKIPKDIPGPSNQSKLGKDPKAPRKRSQVSEIPAPLVMPKMESCPVCGEVADQGVPALLFHMAQHHFSVILAASHVPCEAPFKCPLCPHFSENYGEVLTHFLIFHKQLEVMTEHVKTCQDEQSFTPPQVC